MHRDENLLFGVFAVQLKLVTPSQIMEAAGAWATEPAKAIPERLVDAGAISYSDRRMIESLIERAVEAHGGDVGGTLATFGGLEEVERAFHGSIVFSSSGEVRKARVGDVATSAAGDSDTAAGVEEAPGRYTRESEHARGGMGRVLLVHDEHLGRDIALKELMPRHSDGIDSDQPSPVFLAAPYIARFLQEARITSQLEHPSVVPVYELGHRSDGTLYYTMKLVRGRALSQAIREARTLRARLALLPHFVDLCQAMAYAHSRGVIHRDIKPDNVMVGEFGETVVIDWGLAKARGGEDVHADGLKESLRAMSLGEEKDAATTAYGRAMGTPAYMPPEQAKGQLEEIDERSDVYSLGAVLYELLTGKPPFEGKDLVDILSKVISDESIPVKELEPEAPLELIAICERALQKAPARRYQSARELAEDVRRFQSGTVVQAYAYSPSEMVRRYVVKHKPLFAGAAAALLIIGGLTVVYVSNIVQANREIRERNRDILEANIQLRAARNEADIAKEEMAKALLKAEDALYIASIQDAAFRINDEQFTLAVSALLRAPERLRNWEWGHLMREANSWLPNVGDEPIEPSGPDRTTAEVWADAQGRYLAGLHGHTVRVQNAWYGAGGRRIVSSAADGTKIWDSVSDEELAWLNEGTLALNARLSPDGSRVVTGYYDGTVRVWDVESRKNLATLSGHSQPLFELRFSPDGKRVVTGSNDKTAKVWDIATGKEITTLAGHSGAVTYVEFSSDGSQVVTASVDGTVKTWDAESGRELSSALAPRLGDIVTVQLSSDFSLAVCVFGDGSAYVWDTSTGRIVSTLTGGYGGSSLAFSPDRTCVVAPAMGGGAIVWDVATGAELYRLPASWGAVVTTDFAPDGLRFVTGDEDGTLRIWAPQHGVFPGSQGILEGHTDIVYHAGFSPDGSQVVTASYDGTARVWHVLSGRELATLSGHGEELFYAGFSRDGTRITTCTWGLKGKVWDARTYEELSAFGAGGRASHLLMIGGVRGQLLLQAAGAAGNPISPDGSFALFPANLGVAEIWDVGSGALRFKLPGHMGQVLNYSISPNGDRLLTMAMPGLAMKMWDPATGEELFTIPGHKQMPMSSSFSPDGTRFLTTSLDGTVKIWDAASGAEIWTLVGHAAFVVMGRFSQDGNLILTASSDQTAILWEGRSGERLATLAGHNGLVNGVAFSPDGTRILTTSVDNTVKLWNLDGLELLTLKVDGVLTYALWSPDGTRILTCSRDGTAKLWEASLWRDMKDLGDDTTPLEKRLFLWQEQRANVLAAR